MQVQRLISIRICMAIVSRIASPPHCYFLSAGDCLSISFQYIRISTRVSGAKQTITVIHHIAVTHREMARAFEGLYPTNLYLPQAAQDTDPSSEAYAINVCCLVSVEMLVLFGCMTSIAIVGYPLQVYQCRIQACMATCPFRARFS